MAMTNSLFWFCSCSGRRASRYLHSVRTIPITAAAHSFGHSRTRGLAHSHTRAGLLEFLTRRTSRLLGAAPGR